MKIPKIKNLFLALVILTCSFMITAGSTEKSASTDDFEKQVEGYLQKFPYQETYRYAMVQTGGDPAKLNIWVNSPRGLLKAGEDKVVRSNNDTVYRMAWVYLGDGPVILSSNSPSKKRFTSFQLQDDRNVNYRNIVDPDGSYTLYHGEKPENITGQAVEVPSLLSTVITRIEVKDKNDPADLDDALSVYDGLTIKGPAIGQFPVVDVLSDFDERVVQEAERRMQETKKTVPYLEMIAGPGQEPGKDVSYLNFATGTKEGYGGPDPSHSAYESWYNDASGETLDGSKGEYVLTTEAPQVKAFWSVTVYDSATGRFHPNDDDRYHINNTTAVKNEDGTYAFRFKVKCEEGDVNCLEVPAGPFDVAVRYYLPGPEIISGEWTMPRPVLKKSAAATTGTEKVLRHVVLVKFKEDLTEGQVQEVVDAFAALKGKVEPILDIEYGTNISMENQSAGFTHAFVITFADQKGLDDTLPHPAHLEFAKLARARVDDMLMFDYFAKQGASDIE